MPLLFLACFGMTNSQYSASVKHKRQQLQNNNFIAQYHTFERPSHRGHGTKSISASFTITKAVEMCFIRHFGLIKLKIRHFWDELIHYIQKLLH